MVSYLGLEGTFLQAVRISLHKRRISVLTHCHPPNVVQRVGNTVYLIKTTALSMWRMLLCCSLAVKRRPLRRQKFRITYLPVINVVPNVKTVSGSGLVCALFFFILPSLIFNLKLRASSTNRPAACFEF